MSVEKTTPHTNMMPAPPTLYAISRPAHQYIEQKMIGPRDLPTWPERYESAELLIAQRKIYVRTETAMIAQFLTALVGLRLETGQAVQTSDDSCTSDC